MPDAAHYDFAYSTCTGTAPTPAPSPADQAARSAAAATAVQSSLNPILRFQPWPYTTPRGLSYTAPTTLLTATYPTSPPNTVTYLRRPSTTITPADPRAQWHVYSPTVLTGAGLVYFQGGAVPATAYAALAFQLAARGHLVVLVDVPGRVTAGVALTAADAPALAAVVAAVADAYAHRTAHWAVGGHSRGALAAAIVAAAAGAGTVQPPVYAAVLHGGNPAGTALKNSSVPVVAVYGTLDVAPSPANFNPAVSVLVPVTGANHRQTGDYEYLVSINDPAATISIQEQQSVFATKTVEFLDAHIPAAR